MEFGDLTYNIIGSIFRVHQELGPGLLEKVYQEALMYQLKKDGMNAEREVPVPIMYDGQRLASDLRIDILVEDTVVLELKSVEHLQDVHKKQLLTYLRLADKRIGYLINFNATSLDKSNIIRIVN